MFFCTVSLYRLPLSIRLRYPWIELYNDILVLTLSVSEAVSGGGASGSGPTGTEVSESRRFELSPVFVFSSEVSPSIRVYLFYS